MIETGNMQTTDQPLMRVKNEAMTAGITDKSR